jgi:hypothetical protein
MPGTQEIEDAINSPICSTLLSACMTKIFLPDNSATDPLTSEAYTKLVVYLWVNGKNILFSEQLYSN